MSKKNKKKSKWELIGMRRSYDEALFMAHIIAFHDWERKGSIGGIGCFYEIFKPNYVKVWGVGEEFDDAGSLIKEPEKYLVYVNREMALG